MLLACFGSERFTLFELRNALILLQNMVLRKIGGIWVIRHRGRCKLKNAAVSAASPARIAGFSHHRVGLDQQKVAQLPALCTTLLAPDPEDPTSTILELDEFWSFMLKKANDSWMWIALCRRTRQVVAYAVGDRSRQDVSAVVGSHSRGVSPGALLHRFLGGLRGGDSGGATHSRGQRDRRNGSHGTVE